MDDKEEKKFIFPENISSDYGVFLGLSAKEVVIYVAPILSVCFVFLLIPPHSLKWVIIKLIISILITTVAIAILTTKPVKRRSNIRLTQHLRLKGNYSKRQHLFFRSKNNRREI